MFNNSTDFTMPVMPAYGSGYSNGGMFGGDGLWGLIIILALLGGFGNGGFGGFGGFGGGRVEPCATQADVRAAVDQQTLISKIDQQTYGLADSFTALNNTLNNNFRGIDNAICTLGYQNQQGFNTLGHQISDCCCATQRAIDGVNYNMATQACDIKHAINDSTRSILDFLTTDKIATLQAENQNLKLRASQAEQNAYLLNELKPCPSPAYVVQPPTQVTFPTNCCGGVSYANFGYNNGGCGCGCA
jgi:hypothetical protein